MVIIQESEPHIVGNDMEVGSTDSRSKDNEVFNGRDDVVVGSKEEGLQENVVVMEAKERLRRASKHLVKLKNQALKVGVQDIIEHHKENGSEEKMVEIDDSLVQNSPSVDPSGEKYMEEGVN